MHRIAKRTSSGQVRYFVYNENKQLIGEYDSSGNAIEEYIYFGLRPVAVKTSSGVNIIHTDYLSTPRVVTNGGSTVWQWKNDNPYGNNVATGSMEFNLRFAGQYYDSESGLNYNLHRTYDPESGRYLQSDPIGLAGGFNTYNYVNKNPLDGIDPLGLILVNMLHPQSSNIAISIFEDFANNSEAIFKIIGNRDSDTINILGHGNGDSINHTTAEDMAKEIISGYYDVGFRTDENKNNHTYTNQIYYNNKFKENLVQGKNIHIVLNACDTGTGSGYADKLYKILRQYLNENGYNTTKLQIDAPTSTLSWKYWKLSTKPLEDSLSGGQWRTIGEKFE